MTDIEEYKPEFFQCDCHSMNHVIVVMRGEDGLVITVQMNQWRSWYRRVWLAIKYVFNYAHDDHWDAWILKPEDVDRFKTQLDGLEEDMARYHSESFIYREK